MVTTADVGAFAGAVTYDDLPASVREATKRRVLDGVAAAVAAFGAPPADGVRRAVSAGGADGRSRLWGTDSGATPAEAALHAGALVGAGNGPLFVGPPPSPTAGPLAAVLTAGAARDATGEDVLAGLAVAGEVHGELVRNVPLEEFHPATHAVVGAAAGAGRAAGLEASAVADAVGIAAARPTLSAGGEGFDALAAGAAAREGVAACLLADGGVDGPETLSAPGWGGRFGSVPLDFDPGCGGVRNAAVRPYDAHPHAQAAIEAAVDLATSAAIDPAEVDSVTVETYAAAAPHVDPSAVAAALVDRELRAAPGARADLEPIADAVEVRAVDALTARADRGETPARVAVEYRDDTVREATVARFTGHPSVPAPWGRIEEKFHALASGRYDPDRRDRIIGTVRGLEAETAAELTRLLD